MRIFLSLALAAVLAVGATGCDDDPPTGTCYCGDGVCDPEESCLGCEDCCVAACDLSADTGIQHDYIIDSIRIPTNSAEAQEIGVDIDGDGDIDNKLGVGPDCFDCNMGPDPNVVINQRIADGDLILLGRFFVDAFPTDDVVIAQIFRGAIPTGGATPIFDGNDVVEIDPASQTDLFLCGRMNNGSAALGPGTLNILFPLPGAEPMPLTLQSAQITGSVTVDGWVDVMIGGGLSRANIESQVVPEIADFINSEIATDPTGSTATTILGLFDDQCNTTVPGCENAGPPDCEANDPIDPTQDPWVTVTEIRCNALFYNATEPDVDSDGDGVDDLVSVGMRVTAVPVTIQ